MTHCILPARQLGRNVRETGSASTGILFALAAYGIWGVTPIYWKALAHFPASELLAHRVVWSCLTGVALLAMLRQGSSLRAALADWRHWGP